MLELLMLIIKWEIQVGQNNNKAHNATETNNTDEALRLIVLKQFRNLHTLALVLLSYKPITTTFVSYNGW